MTTDSTMERFCRISRGWYEANHDPVTGLAVVRGSGGEENALVCESIRYARILVYTGGRADRDLAVRILESALGRRGQNADPGEEVATGVAIGEMLASHGGMVRGQVGSAMKMELGRICEGAIERWPSPARTSEALETAACLAGGGTVLGDVRISGAGCEKLREVSACVHATGSFNEYNSPVLAASNLRSLSFILRCVRDQEGGILADDLWRRQWLTLIEHLHTPTGQIAGPYFRAAGGDMSRYAGGNVKFHLHRAFGRAVPLGRETENGPADVFPAMAALDPDCPPDLKERFGLLPLPRSVVETVDSLDGRGTMPEGGVAREVRIEDRRRQWRELIESKGTPGRPGFRGQVQRITSYLDERLAVGSANGASLDEGAVPVIAHWPSARTDRANYLTVNALAREEGRWAVLKSAALCTAQQEARILGLLRFETDPKSGDGPRAEEACLAFHVNADCEPEVLAPGSAGEGRLALERGVIVRAEGCLAGIRILRARVPGSGVTGADDESPVPRNSPEEERGLRLNLKPLSVRKGQPAYVAFAIEFSEETKGDGVSGMMRRLKSARVADESPVEGKIRLAWGSTLGMVTSARVLERGGWLTREGAVS